MKSCDRCKYEVKEENINLRGEIILIIFGSILFFTGTILEKRLHTFKFLEYSIFLTGYILTGYNVLFTAFKNVIKGKIFDENFLMSFATIGAILIRELPEALLVMILFKLGDLLQNLLLNRSRQRIKSLIHKKPSSANLKINNTIKKVPVENIKKGDIIVVRPGEIVPCDGKILNGLSFLDVRTLTGEFVPKTKRRGDEVLSGMINLEGVLEIKVTRDCNDSYTSKILRLIEEAEERKSKTEKFITRFSKYYTPVVLFLSLSIILLPPLFLRTSFYEYFYKGLVLLVISCPCALVISVPLSYFVALGVLAKNGILTKGANFIDAMRDVKTVIFDKTGTLTKGVFEVIKIKSYNGFKEDEILEIAAYAEFHSNHPIASSIKKKFKGEIDVSIIKEYKEVAGLGVFVKLKEKEIFVGNDRFLHEEKIEHNVCTDEGVIVHVVVDRVYAGYILISDEIKQEAKECISLLKSEGIKTGMLTGDNEFFAKIVANELGIDFYKSQLLPWEKLAEIERMVKKKRGKVAFVGDGINDAPSLKRADIGIAMGGLGQDIAIENSDVVIMSDNILKIPLFLKISKITKKIVWQNIIFAVLIKIIFIILGASGIAKMFEAVFADMGVALLVLLNAMRIKIQNEV